MADRRQGDRRETSVLHKKVAISLSSFIYLCVIFVIIIASIVMLESTKNNSYSDGYEVGYESGYAEGYDEGYDAGYEYGYEDGYYLTSNEEE